jgi:PEGA domain
VLRKIHRRRQVAVSRFFGGFLVCALALSSQAQQASSTPQEFAVLRTDRVVVHTGETEHLNCSIAGTGDAAQISCDSVAGSGVPLVYHVALVVGLDHVAYLVSCGGGLVWRIHCRALSAGQVLRGSVQDGKLSVNLDGKARTYRVETSAYIGPIGAKPSPGDSVNSSSPSEESSAVPSVKQAAHVEKTAAPGPASNSEGDQSGAPSNAVKVMVSSEPSGADIYVDDNFMGNTPSLVRLPAGSHAVRIEAKGRKVWTRTISLTVGGEVTLQAALDAE